MKLKRGKTVLQKLIHRGKFLLWIYKEAERRQGGYFVKEAFDTVGITSSKYGQWLLTNLVT